MVHPEMVPLDPDVALGISTSGSHDDRSGDVPVDGFRQRLIRYQYFSLVAAHISALSSVLVVIVWIQNLGGLSWKHGASKQVFNWHPLLMISAFAFMTVASLSFRNFHRPRSKMVHGLSWSVAMISMVVAILAVFRSHNDPVSGFIANLVGWISRNGRLGWNEFMTSCSAGRWTCCVVVEIRFSLRFSPRRLSSPLTCFISSTLQYSFHSWIGVVVLTLYTLQFLSGMMAFGFPRTWTWNGVALASESFKARLLLIHHFWGPMIYFAMMCTILLGIQEKEGFVGCSYSVSKADLFPPSHFYEIPLSCRISHLMGLLIFFTGVFTAFALHPIDRGNYRQN